MHPLDQIGSVLAANRLPFDGGPCPYTSFVYAFFVTNGAAVLPVMTPEDGLLYVGIGADGAGGREHFTQSSGFSALRRMLGAILKERLELQAVARGKGCAIAHVRHYKFTRDSEARLSEWMQGNLLYAECPVEGDIILLERAVIRRMLPPLALAGWKNPQSTMVRRMQKQCADQAWAGLAEAY